MELQFKDLEAVENRLESIGRRAKTGDSEARKEVEVLEQVKEHLNKGKSIRSFKINDEDRAAFIKPIQFLTENPVIYVCKVVDEMLATDKVIDENVKELVA